MRSATAAMTTETHGPTRMAEMPVPQGWEQVPALGTGIGMQEMMKTTAAMSPTSGFVERSSRDISFRRRSPTARNGAATANQRSAQPKGRIPSEMCMAWAGEALKSSNPTQRHRDTEKIP
ncbi:hypothetical protein GHYDROH2_20100 [Geobacter hydrogenophilus]|uniref:Uncharacterized protein n=1 Tax=Geobacter hydrogenophilus TaxID=40983 RepID=A0A9W6G0E6_9BACT|nr:hypothetical protein GHYDROH2_20100 [Geobacter hydrogenophilus]